MHQSLLLQFLWFSKTSHSDFIQKPLNQILLGQKLFHTLYSSLQNLRNQNEISFQNIGELVSLEKNSQVDIIYLSIQILSYKLLHIRFYIGKYPNMAREQNDVQQNCFLSKNNGTSSYIWALYTNKYKNVHLTIQVLH